MMQSYGAPVQASHLLRTALAGVIQSVRGDEVDHGAEYAEDQARVEPQQVDGQEGYQHDAVLAPR